MITIIAKRIENSKLDKAQESYARNLLQYMHSPRERRSDAAAQTPRGFKSAGLQADTAQGIVKYIRQPQDAVMRREKCIASIFNGFSSPVIDVDDAAREMAADCSLSSKLRDGQGVDHWILSWKATNGEKVSISERFRAARTWIDEMGYGEGHKWTASIHMDTDHIHVHIALCRVNYLTGLVKPHGLYKKDSQRALARVAYEMGWSLEPGSKAKYIPKGKKKIETNRPGAIPENCRKDLGLPLEEEWEPLEDNASEECMVETEQLWIWLFGNSQSAANSLSPLFSALGMNEKEARELMNDLTKSKESANAENGDFPDRLKAILDAEIKELLKIEGPKNIPVTHEVAERMRELGITVHSVSNDKW